MVCTAMLFLGDSAVAKILQISSPDKNIQLTINDEGRLSYQVSFKQELVIAESSLGMAFNHSKRLGENSKIVASRLSSNDSSWQQPWGEREFIQDKYNELQVDTSVAGGSSADFIIRIKVFNDGLGFRYESLQKSTSSIEIVDELTEFVIADAEKVDSWWIPAFGWNRYEYLYQQSKLDKIDRVHTPFTMRLPSGVHLSIHEAALVDFAGMSLDQQRSGVLKASLSPRSDGLKVKTSGNFVTPWRSIQISSDAIGLLNSDLILNLNEPNKLGDVSWVEPGKYVGIWWGMHLNVNTWGAGEKHGATSSLTKEYMDFAAKYGFDGVLVEGWNIGWDGSWFSNGDVFNFSESYADFDLAEVTQYGKNIGVKLIGHHETSGSISNYEKQMDVAYDLYAKHGVSQVKTGYVADGGKAKRIDENGIIRYEWHDSQHMVNHYLHSVQEAAKRKISINTHEPVKDTGLRRTYPNWISREGARGQEFNAWGSPPNSPQHTAILPFTRMLAGPMDFTPGIFNLAFEGLDAENRVQTTLAKQLALYVVLYSPIQMAADLPEHYQQNLLPFQFIQDVPTDWQQSKALAGEVGEYVVFARQERFGQDWYVGALTNEDAREIEVSLDFLNSDKTYEAQIYGDGKNADWRTTPYDIVIEKRLVTNTDVLALHMASSGGSAIRFKVIE
ncbi:MAG: alpha-glucosidase [Paraglaciecola sp.]|jgi:alpha-glucosidase